MTLNGRSFFKWWKMIDLKQSLFFLLFCPCCQNASPKLLQMVTVFFQTFFVLHFRSIRLDYFCWIALGNPTSTLICNIQVRWCSMIACSQKKVIIFSLTLPTDMLQPDILSEVPTAPFTKRGCSWQRFSIISFHSVFSLYVFFCININPYSIGNHLYCSLKDEYNLSFHIVSSGLFHGTIKNFKLEKTYEVISFIPRVQRWM